jgi:hypothetical protein
VREADVGDPILFAEKNFAGGTRLGVVRPYGIIFTSGHQKIFTSVEV